MKKSKFLSLFLAVVLALSCFYAAGTVASAADEGVVYFDNSITNFDVVKCGMYNDGDADSVSFEDMTVVSGDVWSYAFSGEFDKIVFTDGETKSAELDFAGSEKIAKPLSWEDGFDAEWADYTAEDTVAAQTESDKKAKIKTSAGASTVYCKNEAGWSTVYCYMWNSGDDSNAGWPGEPMKDTGDKIWEYTPKKSYAHVIFNANDNPKTADLDTPSGLKIFNNSSNNWEDHSVGPIKISSFKTGVESPSYTNVSVVVSASATSTAGTVSYKFSVKDSGGASSVLSDGATSTVAWIPSKAGKYTLTLDVTDTAGNKESRSLPFEIKDASTLESAFISAFTNSLGTNKTILLNSNVTFTTGAIGGKVGTNLLFYKFVITGPDSKTNVAYYTTGNTYTYKPTALGTYTVEAFVQNSYNDTVSNTYTFNCATSIPDDDKNSGSIQPATGGGQPATQGNQPATGSQSGNETQGEPVSNPKLGDVNRDGNISIKDVTLIQKSIAYMTTLDNEQKKLADVTKDGNINIKDATTIQKYIAYMITSF